MRMKRLALIGFVFALLNPSAAVAQSRIAGTWKIDANTLAATMPKGQFVWLVNGGVYECKSCTPPIRVHADGRDQPTPGQAYDTISVAIVDDRTIRLIEKKHGQVVSDEKFTVSADGNTVTDEFANWKVSMRRTANAPTGAHVISGQWQPFRLESTSDRGLLIAFRLDGDTVEMSRPTGESYAAKLDGTDARYNGEPRFNSVSVKRIDANTLEETDKFNGRVLVVSRMTVSADGETMTIAVRDLESGTSAQFAAKKEHVASNSR